jgi:hypothetical protein
MAAPRSLKICLDESMGRRAGELLISLRAPGHPDIYDMRALGLANQSTSDVVLLAELAKRDMHVLITKDSRMLAASIRQEAWRASQLTLFLLEGKWGNLAIFEQVRRLLWWWPHIIAQANEGPQGSAWKVSATLTESGLKRIP